MKKLFITFATIATITCNYANASSSVNIPANLSHIEVTDDAINNDEDENVILAVKPLVSEGSFSKAFLDKIVEFNTQIDKFIETHPNLTKTVGYAIIVGGLILIIPAFISNPIMMTSVLAACYFIIQIAAAGEEYLIDLLVDKGYSEEDVNKYVCACFSLCEKLFTVAAFASSSTLRTVKNAKVIVANFSPIKVKQLVAQRFTFSLILKRKWKSFIKGVVDFWRDIQKQTVAVLSPAS